MVAATIASYLPFPGVGLAGDLALWAMGESTGMEVAAGVAIGLIPGGKLLGKLGGFVSNIGASAWKSAKHYAGHFGGLVAKATGRAGELVGSLAARAKKWVDEKVQTVRGRACGGCFAAATLVWTANGAVPIGELGEGDTVLAAPDSGASSDYTEASIEQWVNLYEAAVLELVLQHADGTIETLRTTSEHPFHNGDGDTWMRADQLVPGDGLSTLNGVAEVLALRFTGVRMPVYNLSIPDAPTYYVGTHGVWVHNAGCDPARDYREIFISMRQLPANHQVHHRIPQKYRGLFTDGRVDRPSNWAGVPREIHHQINGRWNTFRAQHPAPTADEVKRFADEIDSQFGMYYLLPE